MTLQDIKDKLPDNPRLQSCFISEPDSNGYYAFFDYHSRWMNFDKDGQLISFGVKNGQAWYVHLPHEDYKPEFIEYFEKDEIVGVKWVTLPQILGLANENYYNL